MDQDALLECYLKEYEKLKDEQSQRIGFRDNLIYATLVAVGGVFSFTLANPGSQELLLVLPLVCFVLGWTYHINDKKISGIGRYVRATLKKKVAGLMKPAPGELFGWEEGHRTEPGRRWNKFLQLTVDLLLFVGPGIYALAAVWLEPGMAAQLKAVAVAEAVALLVLAVEMIRAVDFR